MHPLFMKNHTSRAPLTTIDSVRQFVFSQRGRFVDLCTTLVEIESPSADHTSQHRLFSVLKHEFEALGCEVDWVPGATLSAGHLLIRRKPGAHRPLQLIVAHGDTVWPVGTLKQMPCLVTGDRIMGPGIFDMKASLAQILLMFRAFRELNLDPELDTRVIINSDEEIGSPESEPVIRRWSESASRVFVMEPAQGPQGDLKVARRGVLWFEVLVTGRAAHAGADPHKGVSAIHELADLIQRMCALTDDERGISVNVGTIAGGVAGNVIAPTARATVDIRVTHLEDAMRLQQVLPQIQPRSPDTRLELTHRFFKPPMEATPGNSSLFQQARGIAAAMNLDVNACSSGGASDANTASQVAPTLDGLGAVGDGAHASHEYVEIDRTLERAALLTLLALSPAHP